MENQVRYPVLSSGILSWQMPPVCQKVNCLLHISTEPSAGNCNSLILKSFLRPLIYSSIFPSGEHDWSFNIKLRRMILLFLKQAFIKNNEIKHFLYQINILITYRLSEEGTKLKLISSCIFFRNFSPPSLGLELWTDFNIRDETEWDFPNHDIPFLIRIKTLQTRVRVHTGYRNIFFDSQENISCKLGNSDNEKGDIS